VCELVGEYACRGSEMHLECEVVLTIFKEQISKQYADFITILIFSLLST
jgi:hypothetical protein